MQSSYVSTQSSKIDDVDSNNAEMAFGYPDIWKPV